MPRGTEENCKNQSIWGTSKPRIEPVISPTRGKWVRFVDSDLKPLTEIVLIDRVESAFVSSAPSVGQPEGLVTLI
jgi:hypothetical protein